MGEVGYLEGKERPFACRRTLEIKVLSILFSLGYRGLNETIFGQDVRLTNRTSNWTQSGRDFRLPLRSI